MLKKHKKLDRNKSFSATSIETYAGCLKHMTIFKARLRLKMVGNGKLRMFS